MTKEELRTDFVGKGWEVQPVESWTQVSTIEGKVKYDVNAVSPTNQFGTAQVVVTDDGGAGEAAVAEGFWKETSAFGPALRDFLKTKEDEVATIYAIATTDIQDAEEVAEVRVYSESGEDVSSAMYVVKRRNDTWDFKKLV